LNEGRLVRIQNGVKTALCDLVVAGGLTATRTGSNVVLRLRMSKVDKNTNRLLRTNEQTSISLRN